MELPVVDLEGFEGGSADRRRRIGAEADRACREVGFFTVVGHGVAGDIIAEAYGEAIRFFDLPLAERLAVRMPEPGYPYGYSPFSREALNRSIGGAAPPDLKETFNVGPIDPPPRPIAEMTDRDERAVYAPNLWPPALPSLRPAVEAYYRSMAGLAGVLMEVFAVALGLRADAFAPFVDAHGSALRLAHYPGLDSDVTEGQLRAGAHTDYGTLTILHVDDEPGLQVELTGGTWIDVAAVPGGLVVNVGDLMQRWTNDRFRSTMHRVVVPADARRRRLTMPFFHNANWDARIECIVTGSGSAHYPPTTAGRHLMDKFRSTVT
jgi:isopenicillin N synthase-like dioxygenase